MPSILMVPLIMGCALVGTIGLLKAIEKARPEQFNQNDTTNKQDGESRWK